jgi:hypothetical protein
LINNLPSIGQKTFGSNQNKTKPKLDPNLSLFLPPRKAF